MHSILTAIVQEKQREVAQLPDQKPLRRNDNAPARLQKALQGGALSVIAEIKRASPSKGAFADIADPLALAKRYVAGGANAISVLTDKYFHGQLDDLINVKKGLQHPEIAILRKDFIIDKKQLVQSQRAGADAVLLIVALLAERTREFIDAAHELGLDALVEVHNERELDIALAANATIIGVNNRNLQDFSVDLSIAKTLKARIPDSIVSVAESGIHTSQDAQTMAQWGYDAILVGEALVKTAHKEALIAALKGNDL